MEVTGHADSSGPSGPSGTGPWTRIVVGLQVVVTILLAVAIAGLLPWIAERPGLHHRFDLSTSHQGALDPSTEELLLGVPGDVRIDVFFRPLEPPWRDVSIAAQDRMRELLIIAQSIAPTKVRIAYHDLADVAEARSRMRELSVEKENVVVVSVGDHHASMELFPQIADVDTGNPDPRRFVPARIARFKGEEALAEALKKVSVAAPPRILFTTGHGERDLYGTEGRDIGRLHTALVGDGFLAEEWNSAIDPRIPADCDVLAIVDPRQPFAPAEMEATLDFVAGGGRVFAAPGPDTYVGPASLKDLATTWGVILEPGIVCAPIVDPFTGQSVDGDPRCASVRVGSEGITPNHPITAPLYKGKRRVHLPLAVSFARGVRPPGGNLLDLLSSPASSWKDMPDDRGAVDYRFARGREEKGRYVLSMSSAFPVGEQDMRTEGEPDAGEARIFMLGCPDALSVQIIDDNRDLLLNAFNWLASREFRTGVAPRNNEPTLLPLDGTELATMNRIGAMGLPAACLVLGLLLAWRRRTR